jgi:hypothetical protein
MTTTVCTGDNQDLERRLHPRPRRRENFYVAAVVR